MFENLIYPAVGFIAALLGLEAAWHFTACKLPDKTIKPCMYKQVKLALVRA
jgi:CheY-like chemotaxis protein